VPSAARASPSAGAALHCADVEPLTIGADQARRFLVRRHLLAPPRSLPARPESVLRVVDRLGSLQFDPLEVPGARNHDLVLHARIAGYERGWCDSWLYGRDRQLIELYNKSLNILPMGELPHYRIAWDRSSTYYRDTILREQAAVADAIVERIRTDGPLSTSAFAEHGHAVDWWWAPTRAARAVMEALFVTGRLGIARRDGNRRYYDLIERLVPSDLLGRREAEEEAMRHRLLSRFRAVGLMAPDRSTETTYGTGTAAERARRTAELVDAGALIPIQLEGIRGTRFALAEERPLLDASATAAGDPDPGVAFLAPLDPLVWDRRLIRELYGFDYIWEVYVPAAKRRHGYYVLPILFGDRLVGRIEPRYERRTRTLTMLGVWFEYGFRAADEPGFVPALGDAVEAYRRFVGADSVTWPRGTRGRAIGRALRAVAGR
jgi:uncharacterized protein YcaQ